MALVFPTKDPEEVWELYFNWLPQLEIDGDTLVSSTWEVDTGVTIASQSFTVDETVVWIEGGVHGFLYTLKNTVLTANGRTWVSRIKVRVREKYCLVDN